MLSSSNGARCLRCPAGRLFPLAPQLHRPSHANPLYRGGAFALDQLAVVTGPATSTCSLPWFPLPHWKINWGPTMAAGRKDTTAPVPTTIAASTITAAQLALAKSGYFPAASTAQLPGRTGARPKPRRPRRPSACRAAWSCCHRLLLGEKTNHRH